MKKRTKKQPEQPDEIVPLAAVPQLYNAKVLEWLQAIFGALSEIHKELVKLNKAEGEE